MNEATKKFYEVTCNKVAIEKDKCRVYTTNTLLIVELDGFRFSTMLDDLIVLENGIIHPSCVGLTITDEQVIAAILKISFRVYPTF